MSNISYIKSDLFSAPKSSIICHACNTHGVWGDGIAKQFANKYPEALKTYQQFCVREEGHALGRCFLINTEDFIIGCLFTSHGFGYGKSEPEFILKATRSAIKHLILQNDDNKPIHMCKINSGLFSVPWDLTAKVLEEFEEQKFTIHEL